jgi:hypothetical protein
MNRVTGPGISGGAAGVFAECDTGSFSDNASNCGKRMLALLCRSQGREPLGDPVALERRPPPHPRGRELLSQRY